MEEVGACPGLLLYVAVRMLRHSLTWSRTCDVATLKCRNLEIVTPLKGINAPPQTPKPGEISNKEGVACETDVLKVVTLLCTDGPVSVAFARTDIHTMLAMVLLL